MIFKGIDNQSVEMKIVNYEFSDYNNGDEYDINWLSVYLNVDSKVGKWQTIAPSLLTSELNEIKEWFYALSKNREIEYQILRFIEPNLSLELIYHRVSKLKKIRIRFDFESRPQSATDDKDYFVDIEADNKELRRIADDLKNEYEKYPERRKPAP